MLTKRVIPCLDVRGGRVVKGVNFVNIRDAGDPVEIAAVYGEQGADELVFLDITATSDAHHGRRGGADCSVFIPLRWAGYTDDRDFRRIPGWAPTKYRSIQKYQESRLHRGGGDAVQQSVRRRGDRRQARPGGG